MSDYIVRAIAADSQIRAFAAVTTETVETARKDHNTSPVATAALGRLLTGGAMTVSYTHLDVYKRQQWNHAGRKHYGIYPVRNADHHVLPDDHGHVYHAPESKCGSTSY